MPNAIHVSGHLQPFFAKLEADGWYIQSFLMTMNNFREDPDFQGFKSIAVQAADTGIAKYVAILFLIC